MPPVLTHDGAPGGGPDPKLPEGPNRRPTVMLSLGIISFMAIAIFWLLIMSGWFNTTSPDRLGDRAWVQRTEKHCKVMQGQIKDLPKAQTAKTPADRATLISRGTQDIQQMLVKLRADRPANAEEQRVVDDWLTDWRIYLGDRGAYAASIQHDPGAKALFTQRHGEAVTDAIDNFATVNNMLDCATPTDV